MTVEIEASLTLTGENLIPDEISALLDKVPTKIWKTGDLISPRSTLRRKQNGWSLSSNVEDIYYLESHVKSIFEKLRSSWESLVNLCHLYDAEISCVVYVDVGDSVPAIHFDQDTIQKVAELNAEIDVDLYYLEN